MKKCNIDDSDGNKTDTYSNTRNSSYCYTNDDNNTRNKFTCGVPSTLLCVGIMIIICKTILVLNMAQPDCKKKRGEPLLLAHDKVLSSPITLEYNEMKAIGVAFEFGVAILLWILHIQYDILPFHVVHKLHHCA